MIADERPINAGPWLYRIARNNSINHLRRFKTVGLHLTDVEFVGNGTSTADAVNNREEFSRVIDDIRVLPETQRTALLMREINGLSYEQIAEAMEKTVMGVKSLLFRARTALASARQARAPLL